LKVTRKIKKDISKIKDLRVFRYIKKLRLQKNITEREMLIIYQTFVENIKTEEQMIEVITFVLTITVSHISSGIVWWFGTTCIRIISPKFTSQIGDSKII
jgi:hypothetical protein